MIELTPVAMPWPYWLSGALGAYTLGRLIASALVDALRSKLAGKSPSNQEERP